MLALHAVKQGSIPCTASHPLSTTRSDPCAQIQELYMNTVEYDLIPKTNKETKKDWRDRAVDKVLALHNGPPQFDPHNPYCLPSPNNIDFWEQKQE